MTELLVSTSSALLRVRFDHYFSRLHVDTVETGFGVYFGLTRFRDRILAVSRNVDLQGRQLDPRRPTNAILELDEQGRGVVAPPWSLPEFRDLHQIRWHDDCLWVVTGVEPELLAVDPVEKRLIGSLSLRNLVPEDLRHEANPEHPDDLYHFNSLHFRDDRLWLLAHNWSHGAFALEMECLDRRQLLEKPRVVEVYRRLGVFSHDIALCDGRLMFLDSAQSTVHAGDFIMNLPRADDDSGRFARGLAAGAGHFFVGSGRASVEREKRADGASCCTVIDRPAGRIVADFSLGDHGNVCDVLLLSEPDQTDSTRGDPDRHWVIRTLHDALKSAGAESNRLEEQLRQAELQSIRHKNETIDLRHLLHEAEAQLRPVTGLNRFAVEVAWFVQGTMNRLSFLTGFGKRIRRLFRGDDSPPAPPPATGV